jgi:glycosyltransferase involved in cell wall biosynthesis
VAVCNKVMRSGSLSKDEITLLNKRMAPEHYWYVRLALLAGREAAARKALIAGIRLDPWNIKLYAYFALSILGNRQYLDLKKLMKKLRYHSAGRRTSRDERPSGNQQSENTDFSRPKVSVVIATYNYGRFLGEAIQSVLNQTFQDFEIIVADDGSTDNTREIVEKFSDPRIRYIYQDHIGVSAAENAGLRAARGEYITGIGADDLYLPQNLETKVKLLDSHPETGMVYSDCYFFDDITGAITGNLWRSAKGLHPWFDPERAARQPLKELLYRGCFIMPQASMMRRQVFATVGYFDESLPTYEDWDLIIRILQHFPAELIDIPLLKLRQHSTNLTGNKEKMYLGVAAAANKVVRSGSLSRDEFRYLRKRLVPQHLEYGRQALADGREAAARKALMACIRLNPRKIKPYVYLLMSLLGTKRYLALRSFKKVASHHSIQVRSSGGASCERDKLLSK